MSGKVGVFSSLAIGIVAVALTLGAALSAGASWVAWRGAPSLPTDAEAGWLSARLVPGAQPIRTARHDVVFDYPGAATTEPWRRLLLGDDDYDAGFVEVTSPVPDGVATVRDALGRLRADGWQVRRQGAAQPTDRLTARLGRDYIELRPSDPAGRVTVSPSAVTLVMRRAEPPLVPYATIGGWVVGPLIGLGLVVRGVRRRARAAFVLLAGLGVLALLPGTVLACRYALTYLTGSGPALPDAPWGGYMLWPVKPAAIVGGGLLLLAALVALASRRPAQDGGAAPGRVADVVPAEAANDAGEPVPEPDVATSPVTAASATAAIKATVANKATEASAATAATAAAAGAAATTATGAAATGTAEATAATGAAEATAATGAAEATAATGAAEATEATAPAELSEETVMIPAVPAADPGVLPADPFVRHENPIWRDRADFVINAALPGRFEQIWARQVADDQFEVCCIPFQLYGVALGDVVETSPAGGLQYVVKRVLTPSGRHVFRVFFSDPFQPQAEITLELAELGALLEYPDPSVLAVDARDDEQAARVEAYLRAAQGAGHLGFEIGRRASDQPDPLGLSAS